MSNRTADYIHRTRVRGASSFVVKNSTTLYAGSLVGTDANGYLDNWADTAGLKFEGLLLAGAVGNTSASPKVEGRVNTSGPILMGVPVSGASTIACVNAMVYSTTGNTDDLTLTATSNVGPIGRIVRWTSATDCEVRLLLPTEAKASVVVLTAATGTAGNTIADVGAAFNQTTLNDNFKSLAAKVNEILAVLG